MAYLIAYNFFNFERFIGAIRNANAFTLAAIILFVPALTLAGSMRAGILPTLWGLQSYELFVPSSTKTPKDLIVMLHGCKQNAQVISDLTRFNITAEKEGALVLYPEQDPLRNVDYCWNWFLSSNQYRGWGEVAMISALVSKISSDWHIKRSRTLLVGISSGGAMAAIASSCYPDLFGTVAIHSGLQFRAAEDPFSAQEVIISGSRKRPETSGEEAFRCSGLSHLEIPLILFHGTEDKRVYPVNGDQALEQFAWLNAHMSGDFSGLIPVNPFNVSHEKIPEGHTYAIFDYGKKGNPLLRKVIVNGMEHAWSGGPRGLPNSDPKGPDASQMILEFFRAHKGK